MNSNPDTNTLIFQGNERLPGSIAVVVFEEQDRERAREHAYNLLTHLYAKALDGAPVEDEVMLTMILEGDVAGRIYQPWSPTEIHYIQAGQLVPFDRNAPIPAAH